LCRVHLSVWREHGDDKANRGSPDSKHISLSEQYEVAYWTKTLGVSAEQRRAAVQAVGNSPEKVRAHLGK